MQWDGDVDIAILGVENMTRVVSGNKNEIGQGPLAKDLHEKGITIVIGKHFHDDIPSIYRIMMNGVRDHDSGNAQGQCMDLYMYNKCDGNDCAIYDTPCGNGKSCVMQLDKVIYDSNGKLGKCTFLAETEDDYKLTVPCPADVDGALGSVYPGVDLSKPQYVWSDSQGCYVKST